ncbi:hypothetical protein M413DRAFT_423599 [Hebeloma cylindrosporum]|uniref:Uncharacterized protein n=1 Tax=Hebeloma cylindrosporum TaxID=76867 RepID=A0A0C2XH17_HEBCY|nr:hypothetical protein M413DRAFT_423599 [Hebeloma cylindrosporum h7]
MTDLIVHTPLPLEANSPPSPYSASGVLSRGAHAKAPVRSRVLCKFSIPLSSFPSTPRSFLESLRRLLRVFGLGRIQEPQLMGIERMKRISGASLMRVIREYTIGDMTPAKCVAPPVPTDAPTKSSSVSAATDPATKSRTVSARSSTAISIDLQTRRKLP